MIEFRRSGDFLHSLWQQGFAIGSGCLIGRQRDCMHRFRRGILINYEILLRALVRAGCATHFHKLPVVIELVKLQAAPPAPSRSKRLLTVVGPVENVAPRRTVLLGFGKLDRCLLWRSISRAFAATSEDQTHQPKRP